MNLGQISNALRQLQHGDIFEYDGVKVRNINGHLFANINFELHRNPDFAAQQVQRMSRRYKELERLLEIPDDHSGVPRQRQNS